MSRRPDGLTATVAHCRRLAATEQDLVAAARDLLDAQADEYASAELRALRVAVAAYDRERSETR